MYTADYARKKVSGVVLTNIKNKLSEYGLYLEKRNDEFLFTISIVDVAEQVGPNSPGFDRAWEMIESHFIKGEFQTLVARPLLEEKIILQENKDRPTISVAFKIKKNGDYQCLGIKSTVFRSRKRFHFLKGDQILKNMPKDLDGAFFMALEELALILRAKRLEKLQIPPITQNEDEKTQYDIELLRSGDLKVVSYDEHFKSYHYLSELLIFTNSAIATYLKQEDVPFFYIKQDAPHASVDLSPTSISDYFKNIRPSLEKEKLAPTPSYHWGLATSSVGNFLRPASRLEVLINFYNIRAYLERTNYPFPQEEIEYWIGEIEKGKAKNIGIDLEYNEKKLIRYFSDEADSLADSELVTQEDEQVLINKSQSQAEDESNDSDLFFKQSEILEIFDKNLNDLTIIKKIYSSFQKYMNERIISSQLLFKGIMLGREDEKLKNLSDIILDYIDKNGTMALNIILECKNNGLWKSWEFETHSVKRNELFMRLVIERTNGERWTSAKFSMESGIKNGQIKASIEFLKEFFFKKLVLWEESVPV